MLMPKLDQDVVDQLNESLGFTTPETMITVEQLNAPIPEKELEELFNTDDDEDTKEIGHLKFQGQEFVNEDNVNPSRPQTFDDYIGQTEAKRIVNVAIGAAKKLNRPMQHTLIYGFSGLGKSTLSYLIAGKDGLGLPADMIIETTGGAIETKVELAALLQKLTPVKNTNQCSFLFVDEIHGLPRAVGEALYSCIEDFKFEGQAIPPFTFVGATTEMGTLIKNLEPLVNRCDLQLELKAYNETELQKIILNLAGRGELAIEEEASLTLAGRSRRTARVAVRLLGMCRNLAVYKDKDIIGNDIVLDTMQDMGINDMGLTKKDIALLQYLADKGTVGLSGIAQRLRISEQGYLYHVEPFLVEMDFGERTPRRRKVSQKGKDYIANL